MSIRSMDGEKQIVLQSFLYHDPLLTGLAGLRAESWVGRCPEVVCPELTEGSKDRLVAVSTLGLATG